MKKSFSITYTVIVVLILLGVLVYFGRATLHSRSARIADFETRSQEYTRRLADTLVMDRDVNRESAIAENLMKGDPSLVAVQVYSRTDGLRLSVVKPAAEQFSRTPISDSEGPDGFMASWRYHTVSHPMSISDMPELEAVFIAATLTGAEIRSSLLIILITVLGLFLLTLLLILIRPGMAAQGVSDEEYDEACTEEETEGFRPPGDISTDGADFHLPSIEDGLTEADDLSETLSLDEHFELPDLDDEELMADEDADFVTRLGHELEKAASFNQDLTLLIFRCDESSSGRIRAAFNHDDLCFDLQNGQIAIVEVNKDLDETLESVEELVLNIISTEGHRHTRAGLSTRNGRLMEGERLFREALAALDKTTEETNIVAFRPDPQKYREYLRNKQEEA